MSPRTQVPTPDADLASPQDLDSVDEEIPWRLAVADALGELSTDQRKAFGLFLIRFGRALTGGETGDELQAQHLLYGALDSRNFTPKMRQVWDMLPTAEALSISPKEIVQKTGVSANSINAILRKFERLGLAINPQFGLWRRAKDAPPSGGNEVEASDEAARETPEE